MRIAFFSDNFYPELSGITDTIITTGKELRRRGHEICYVGPRYSAEDYLTGRRDPPAHESDDTVDGIPIIRLPSLPMPVSPTGQSRLVLPRRRSRALLATFRPDIVHTQSPYGVGWEALDAARHFGVPLVGTNHTAIEDFFPLSSVMRAYDAWYYNHCDFVTTPYETLISRMREKGFTRPAHVVANPVDLKAFAPAEHDLKLEMQQSFNITGPVVLYAGRLGTEKNVDVVIRAMPRVVAQFPTATLVATGHGAAEQGLRKLAQQLAVEKNVHFTGFLPRAIFPHLYNAADVFTIMSTSDSQSIALMQAYASGIPAVCARSRGLPDYTPEEAGFLVEPGDHLALADKLIALLGNDTLRTTMGRHAQDFVKKLSPEIIAQEWERIYKDVLPKV